MLRGGICNPIENDDMGFICLLAFYLLNLYILAKQEYKDN